MSGAPATGGGRALGFWHPVSLLATWFGAGLLPKAPGTWGSLAALPFAWGLYQLGGTVAVLAAAVVVGAIGYWAAERYMTHTGQADPGPVVIDEVVGQWLALAFVPAGVWAYVFGFVLFRAADIGKPWPASWAERNLGGGRGVMADDVIAGLYAALGLAIVRIATGD